eukprot:scaffold97746_cov84-Phaeocystis_antarctica.AAC.1
MCQACQDTYLLHSVGLRPARPYPAVFQAGWALHISAFAACAACRHRRCAAPPPPGIAAAAS